MTKTSLYDNKSILTLSLSTDSSAHQALISFCLTILAMWRQASRTKQTPKINFLKNDMKKNFFNEQKYNNLKNYSRGFVLCVRSLFFVFGDFLFLVFKDLFFLFEDLFFLYEDSFFVFEDLFFVFELCSWCSMICSWCSKICSLFLWIVLSVQGFVLCVRGFCLSVQEFVFCVQRYVIF